MATVLTWSHTKTVAGGRIIPPILQNRCVGHRWNVSGHIWLFDRGVNMKENPLTGHWVDPKILETLPQDAVS